jgi:hypothetical protein
LFLLYIHDVPRCYVQGLKTVLYADDTNVLVQHRDETALKTKNRICYETAEGVVPE